MAVNIKDDEATRLIRELAGETGETLTAATRIAVSERLARIRATKDPDATVEEILAIGREIAARLVDVTPTALDHDRLYDDAGLPR